MSYFAERRQLIKRAMSLETIALAWLLIGTGIATGSGFLVQSLTLVTFGADSTIAYIASLFLLGRLNAELNGDKEFIAAVGGVASKTGAVLRVTLAACSGFGACWRLDCGQRDFSTIGFALAVLTIPLMLRLAHKKLNIAKAMRNPLLHAGAERARVSFVFAIIVAVGLLAQLVSGRCLDRLDKRFGAYAPSPE